MTLEFEAVASKKIGKTTEVRFADGRAIPRGEYLIYLTAVDQQSTEIQSRLDAAPSLTAQLSNEFPKNTRILAFKRYFLAGSKDLSYQERLKDFHEKLRARALSELNESKQFIATLSSQLTLTQDQFAAIKSHKPSVHKADLWEKFHTSWIKLQGELDQIFAKWTPDAIKNEYFYGFIYKEIQDAAQALGRVHSRQTDYFKGGVPPQNSDAELSGELKRIDDNLRGLQSKLEQAEKLPPTPGGMPQREGL